MITALFIIFAGLIIISSVLVVSSRNPVHSVLFLIFAFFNAAGIFLIAGAEFLAMLLVIVYVGAVAVLFLFVVMMLDVDFATLRQQAVRYGALGFAVAAALLAEIVMVILAWRADSPPLIATASNDPQTITNTQALGQVLYTDYLIIFQSAGLVLLVAMIGAIVLTLRQREGVKKQNIASQIARKRSDTLEIRQVTSGEGVHIS